MHRKAGRRSDGKEAHTKQRLLTKKVNGDRNIYLVCQRYILSTEYRWQSVIFCNDDKTASSNLLPLQWGAADAEIKVPSGENTERKRSPFKARSRSVYSPACYAYCQGFLPHIFLPFWSIHLHFSRPSPNFVVCWLWLTPVPV